MDHQLVKIIRANGEELDTTALTKRILEHINRDHEEPDAWLGLTLQEGPNACYLLAQESPIIDSALKLQPALLDFFLLMYQIGALTANAIHKNTLDLSIIIPPEEALAEESQEPNAPISEEDNIRDNQDSSSPSD